MRSFFMEHYSFKLLSRQCLSVHSRLFKLRISPRATLFNKKGEKNHSMQNIVCLPCLFFQQEFLWRAAHWGSIVSTRQLCEISPGCYSDILLIRFALKYRHRNPILPRDSTAPPLSISNTLSLFMHKTYGHVCQDEFSLKKKKERRKKGKDFIYDQSPVVLRWTKECETL